MQNTKMSAESIAREALRWAKYPGVPENLRGFLVGLAEWLRAPVPADGPIADDLEQDAAAHEDTHQDGGQGCGR